MNHYLLYDAACSRCAALAVEIETASAGRLGIRNLRDEAVVTLLDAHAPNRTWEPMVLEVNGDKVRVYSGLAMRAKLVMILGFANAWRVARKVQAAEGPVWGTSINRYAVLKRMSGVLAGLAVIPVFGSFFGKGEDFAPCNPDCRTKLSCSQRYERCEQFCTDANGNSWCASGWHCGTC